MLITVEDKVQIRATLRENVEPTVIVMYEFTQGFIKVWHIPYSTIYQVTTQKKTDKVKTEYMGPFFDEAIAHFNRLYTNVKRLNSLEGF